MNSYQHQINIPFEIQYKGPHINGYLLIKDVKSNLLAIVLKKGPSNENLNFSYKNGERSYAELGEAIYQMCKIAPHGLLIIFSSYGQMNKIYQEWNLQKIIPKINQLKKVIKEPQDKLQAQLALKEFKKFAQKGAILMTVQRGNISEGIDLPDDLIRTIALVGIPYPPVNDKFIEAKKNFMDLQYKDIMKGDEWYQLQAYRAMNQALGRVIRHSKDWGMILMCDERFGYSNVRSNISTWVQSEIKISDNFQQSLTDAQNFFDRKCNRQPEIQNFFPYKVNSYLKKQEEDNYQKSDIFVNQENEIEQYNFQYKKKQIHIMNQEEVQYIQKNNQKNIIQEENPTLAIDVDQRNKFKSVFENQDVILKPQIKIETDKICNICYLEAENMKYSKNCGKQIKLGHIACEQCWESWLALKLECPKCKEKVRMKQLVPLEQKQ